MSNIIPFNFENQSIRVVERNGEPWFVLSDVCAVLGIINPSDAASRLDEDEVTLAIIEGSHRPTNTINESGLYSVILTSRKPEAKKFKKWVTSEVLPSIRKTGGYQMPQPAFHVPQTLPEALRLAADLADQVEQQKAMIEHQKPAVEFVERYVEARSTKSLREAAKVLGVKEREFIATLEQRRILFRQGGNLLPYADYQHRGYFTVKTGESSGHAYQQTRFTPEGINWISKKLGLIGGGAAS